MSARRRSDPRAERPLRRSPGRNRRNRVFFVAVEGEVTEPSYLAHLNRLYGERHGFVIHVISERNGLRPEDVVRRARDQEDDDEATARWALFDRDEHLGIPSAIETAGDVEVGFSHPSFDLWLLLHFSDFGGAQRGSSRVVHEKLRTWPAFAEFGRRHKKLGDLQLRQLVGREEDAVKGARLLVDRCPGGACSAESGHDSRCDPLGRDPSTDVWRLLVALKIVTVP